MSIFAGESCRATLKRFQNDKAGISRPFILSWLSVASAICKPLRPRRNGGKFSSQDVSSGVGRSGSLALKSRVVCILGDPGAVSRVKRKGATKVFART